MRSGSQGGNSNGNSFGPTSRKALRDDAGISIKSARHWNFTEPEPMEVQ